MKDRAHDAGMAELFREDPDFATQYLNSVLEEGEGAQADLQIALRQMAQPDSSPQGDGHAAGG